MFVCPYIYTQTDSGLTAGGQGTHVYVGTSELATKFHKLLLCVYGYITTIQIRKNMTINVCL